MIPFNIKHILSEKYTSSRLFFNSQQLSTLAYRYTLFLKILSTFKLSYLKKFPR